MKAKNINTTKKDLMSLLKDKKYDTLVDSVLSKMQFSLSKGSFLSFPFVQNNDDYNVTLELISNFILELDNLGYKEFPNILLIGIDNNLVDFHFDGYDGFVSKKLAIFKGIVSQKITEATSISKNDNIMDQSKYNRIVSDYALTHNGLEYIDIASNNESKINGILAGLDKLNEELS